MLQVHDLDSGQMLSSLWLWTWLITSNKKQSTVHDSCSSKHSSHERIMTGAIDEGNVSHQDKWAFAILKLAQGFVLFE